MKICRLFSTHLCCGRIAGFSATVLALSLTTMVSHASQGIIGFDDDDWNSDDTRNSGGTSIINSATNSPAAGATSDPAQVAAQIDWRNFLGSRGNLGGVYLNTLATSSQKSTLSKIGSTATPLANGGDLINPSFSASYRWQSQNTASAIPGVALKFGVQSTDWGTNPGESQNGFSASRSGEGVWDLILVFDPTNNGINSSTNGQFREAGLDWQNGKFNVFPQAGNGYFAANYDTSVIGVSSLNSRTLEEWNTLPLSDAGGTPIPGRTWGDLLFDDGVDESKITNVQFGLGSGNQNAAANLDWAEVSILNSGERIDFVDAASYNGTNSDYGSSANWETMPADPSDPPVLTSPNAAQKFVVEQNATLNVTSDQTSRSLGILSGTTDLTISPSQTLTLASAENGTLFVESGATANVTGDGTLDAAVLDSAGTLNLATVANLTGGDDPHPQRDGSGTSRYAIVVQSGGDMTLQSGADITVSQNDRNVGVRVGGDGDAADGVATMTIESGATLDIDSTRVNPLDPNGFFIVGAWGREGVVNQTGGTVNLTQTPGHLGSFNVGNQGGTGTYNLSGGTLNLGGGNHSLGRVASSSVTTPGSGTINLSGTGALNLNNNGFLVVGDRDAASVHGDGTINQTGGTFSVANTAQLYLGGYGNSTYNLNGGTLQIGGNSLRGNFGSATTPYDFNLQGGTIQVTGTDLNSSVDINLNDIDPSPAATVSTINTNGFDATFSGEIAGDGILNKVGTGTMNLSGTNDVFALSTAQGTTAIASGDHTADFIYTGAFSGVGSDGTLDVSGGTVTVSGPAIVISPTQTSYPSLYVGGGSTTSGKNEGTLNFSGGTINVGVSSTPSERVDIYIGGFGGADSEGTVTQTGGVLNKFSDEGVFHIGNQSTGTYNLQDGAINIFGNNGIVLGRSGSTDAGTGTLNVSGGTLTFNDGTDLLLGGAQDTEPLTGSGIVNQTGGVVSIQDGGSLVLGQRGSGTYNLDGGTLEVGGANRIRQGNSGAATFSMGGGVLLVVGSDLTVPNTIDPVLKAATTSTINTNGQNATFSGNFSGSGNLIKAGTGTLTVAGINTNTGTFSATGGTVSVTGELSGSTASFSSGTTLSGTGTVSADSTVEGTLAPGNSPGIITFTDGLTLTGTSTSEFEFLADTVSGRGTNFDGVNITGGDLEILSGATLSLVFDGAGSTVDFTSAFWDSAQSWQLFDSTNSITLATIFDTVLVSSDSNGVPFNASIGSFDVVEMSEDIMLNFTPVPEPEYFAIMISLATMAFVAGRRRKQKA